MRCSLKNHHATPNTEGEYEGKDKTTSLHSDITNLSNSVRDKQ
jgi:hypothetical protein